MESMYNCCVIFYNCVFAYVLLYILLVLSLFDFFAERKFSLFIVKTFEFFRIIISFPLRLDITQNGTRTQ